MAELLAAGVPVGLGTDSLASNDSLDMFAEMRAALAAGAEREGETVAPPLTAEQVLRMATLGGAQALGWGDRTGSLEPGKSADVIAVHLPAEAAARPLGSPDVTGSLLRSMTAADVRMTMVAGTVLFERRTGEGTPVPAVASGYQAARDRLGLGR